MKLFQAYYLLITFLSLIATSPAIAKHAKTGCKDRCGSVTIPYPFGIGEECSINEWYVVDCNSSTPYLPALKHLEVLRVDLYNLTVTVSMPRMLATDCQSIDLGTTPFLFSKLNNRFVFEGCGNVVMMADNGSVVTGCSTTCNNNTLSDRNNCVGISCCETPSIPHYLKSYSINLNRMEAKGDQEGGCGSASLVDVTSYDEGRFSLRNTSFIPISLLWTLPDSDQMTCCQDRTPDRRKVELFDGTAVDTWMCGSPYMDYSIEDNPYLIDGCEDVESEPARYAKKGCKDTCGNVTIPYPFGIGEKCSINQWYIVDCNFSKPYLPALDHLEVLNVSLRNRTVTVSTPRITTDCQNPVGNNSSEIMMGVDLGRSPFLFSNSRHNKFVFEGCGNAVMTTDNGSLVTGCSTTCRNDTLISDDRNDGCFGISCCETTSIPNYLKSYSINLTGFDKQRENGGCGSAFLVDVTSYDEGRFSVPVSLLWTLPDPVEVTCCRDQSPYRVKLELFNGSVVDTWACQLLYSIEDNPYLIDGCKEDEESGGSGKRDECKRCEESGGYCNYDDTRYLFSELYDNKLTCMNRASKISLGVILGKGEETDG